MTLTLDSAKQWITDNPIMAAGIGLATIAIVTLAVSPGARKAVGLGKASTKRKSAKRSKNVSVKRLK